MKKLIFATNNPHKLEEIRHKLEGHFEILSLTDVGCNEELPETGNTLEANAAEKAWYVANKYNIDCFADDTGLEVESLNGEPGVYSARYAGSTSPSIAVRAEANMNKLLQQLEGKPNRKARFRTVIAYIERGREYFFEGIVSGEIGKEKKGSDGFGYDPVFFPEGGSLTFAEMPLEQKNKISHRSRAVEQFAKFLFHRQ
jgi:XTP/dITP diphosphohydrolase